MRERWIGELARMFPLASLIIVPDVCSLSSLSQRLCPTLSSGIKHIAFARDGFSHLFPLSAARPGCPVPPWSKVGIRGQFLHPIQWAEAVDEAIWEFIWGFGSSVSSLLSWLGLSPANHLYRKDFPVCIHGVGVTLVQFRVYVWVDS